MKIENYPVDAQGRHVLPCVSLKPENMEEWMKGFMLSYGLTEVPSTQAKLVDWTDEHLLVEVGSKKKKLTYNPEDVQLCVFQFDHNVVFSNSVQPTKNSEVSNDVVAPETPKQSKTKATYQPKHKIEWN